MTYQHLTIDTTRAVGRLTLNRPDKLNALSLDLMTEIIGAAADLSASDVRAVVVSGAGRAFCAGFDLDWFLNGPLAGSDDPEARLAAARLGGRMADALEQMRPVTVAALHGHVVGGGVVLAAACDLRVVGADTVFAIPEADLGIPLAWGGIPRLVRELGPALTRELVMTCRPFSAREAEHRGFVNRVVDGGTGSEDVVAAAAALAEAVAARPRLAIETTKRHVAEILLGDFARDDAAGLLDALEDAESSAVRAAYLGARGQSTSPR